MRRKLAALTLALALVGVLAYVLWPSGSGSDAGSSDTAANTTREGNRRAGTRTGPVDRTPARVSGVVLDDRGAPIAGAVVSIAQRTVSRGERATPGAAPEPIAIKTGTDGAFEVTELVPGRYTVAASARGFVPGFIDPLALAPAESRDDLELRLTRGGHVLRGTVSDIGGGPVSGALVRATNMSEGNLFTFFRAPATGITNAEGRYELSLGNGAYMVEVTHIDYVSDQRLAEVRDADRTEDFDLVPGGVVVGQVRSRATDEPVGGATVTFTKSTRSDDRGGNMFNLSGMGLSAASTDDKGRFTLRGLSSGGIEIRAFGPGFATPAPTEVELGIGETVEGVIVYVDRAFSITGYVVEKEDRTRGIDGVLIGAFNFGGALHLARESSAEDGYFEIHGIQNGSYIVGAAGDGRMINVMGQNVVIENADLDEVYIELDRGATLSGRVEPPAAAMLTLEMDEDDIGLGNMTQMFASAGVRARANDDGTFTLRGVPAGAFTLVARADDGSEGRLPITVTAAEQRDLVVTLERRSHIAGIVVDPAGAAVTGVRVRASPREQGRRGFSMSGDWLSGGAATGDDGRFRVVGLEPGTYDVAVSDGTSELAWADAEHADAPAMPIEVTLEGTRPVENLRLVVENRDKIIEGIVVGPGGAPVADAWVTAYLSSSAKLYGPVGVGADDASAGDEKKDDGDDDGRGPRRRWRNEGERPVLTDESGRFTITGLRAGNYDLEAEGLKGTARGDVDDVQAGARDARIRIEALAGISGVVTSLGKPVTNYVIEADGPTHRRTNVVDAEGRYRITRLDPGTYSLSVIADEGRGGDEVKVVANQTGEKNLQLIAYGSVHGVLLDTATGEPIENMTVFAFSNQGGDVESLAMSFFAGDGPRTDAAGKFRVGRLGAGKGTFVVMDGDAGGFEMIAQKEFDLGPGQDLDLGEIRGHVMASVPKDQRGELGMTLAATAWAFRPAQGAAKEGAEPPTGLDAETVYLWVDTVEPDGPAAAAGIAEGDRVVSIAGVDVGLVGAETIQRMLTSRRIKAGEPMAFVTDRGGKQRTVNVLPRPVTPE